MHGLPPLVGAAALDRMDLGIFSLDAGGVVHYTNPRGQELLATGAVLRVSSGRLVAQRAAAQRTLATALECVAVEGRTITLWLGGAPAPDEPGLFVAISRVVADAPWGVERALLLFAQSPQPARALDPEQLRALFALTPAEARLAQALGAGARLLDYARRSRLRTSTVRTQLRAVLAKTGCRRQQDLLLLLARIPLVT